MVRDDLRQDDAKAWQKTVGSDLRWSFVTSEIYRHQICHLLHDVKNSLILFYGTILVINN